MPPEVCPLLGTLDDTNSPCPPVEYPSFENHCLVSDDRDTLLLADQASYCLSGGHVVCPRYQIAAAARRGARIDPRVAADLTDGALASDSLRPELMAAALEGDERAASRRWAWLGTGLIFITVMLVGSIFALWSGWQQVQGYLAQREEGSLAAVISPGSDQPAFVVITATPDPLIVAAAPPPTDQATQQNQSAAQDSTTNAAQGFEAGSNQPSTSAAAQVQQSPNQQFPQAVTATPGTLYIDPSLAPQPDNSGGTLQGEVLQDPGSEPPNILLEVPTRRPTPIFDIPTSTPATDVPTAIPTATQTPTPAGTPSVIFAPAQQLVPEGGCTMVSWQVQNVREVYYENIGVDGRGQEEECVDDVLEVFHLVVVLSDGTARTYTTTVTMLQPTHTPQPTATFTPFVEPTPTWTLVPATATPTPSIRYGAVLNISGSTQQDCAPGATCTISLVVMNTGEAIDTLLVSLQESGSWPAQLCRTDGVCARTNLAISDMGPGNSASISFSVTLPGDATGTQRFVVDALSNRSGGNVRSDPIYLDVTAR